ncbi:MAG: hypothetical protein PVH84_05535 [Candidatus Aminicenantes bacterium]|jgi:hypothetical protein
MHKDARFVAFVLLFFFLSSLLLYSLQNSGIEKDKPLSLDTYDVVARGKMSRVRGKRPVEIARMDNNGEILLACLEEKTIEELNSTGIKFLKSQLELLVDWDLLEYDRKTKTYRTTIYVYGPERAAAIRKLIRRGVVQLTDELDSELNSLQSYLESIDRGKNLFAILYAYVLHSYSMNQFGEEIYQKPQLSTEHPFWNGYAWAINPAKKFNTGVTFMPVEGNQLFIVSVTTVPRPNFRQISDLIKDIAPDNKVDNPELRESLSSFDLFDKRGDLTIPIFNIAWSTKLENMAKKVYAKTIELVNSPDLKNILGMETQAQAAMFLHYEIRYALLKHSLEKGTLIAPIDFKNADNNSPADMRNLVFLMKTEKSS